MRRALFLLLFCLSIGIPAESIALPVPERAVLSYEAPNHDSYLTTQSETTERTTPLAASDFSSLGVVPSWVFFSLAPVSELAPLGLFSASAFTSQKLLSLAPKTSPPMLLVVSL